MVSYLLNCFYTIDESNGYWEVAKGDGPSTIATGHAIYSLKVFCNKVLVSCDIDEFVVESQKYIVSEYSSRINDYIKKATNWLIANQQFDGGWSYCPKENKVESAPLCVYYILRGFNSIGKDFYNDTYVKKACLYTQKKIQNILEKHNDEETDLANVLYGYMSLVRSSYFIKGKEHFKKHILKYVSKHWYIISRQVKFKDICHKKAPFVHNMPYIALITLLSAEDYSFERKIHRIINSFIENQAVNGSWSIQKFKENGEEITETTWVTAEVLIALNEVQNKFMVYQEESKKPKQYKHIKIMNAILAISCFFIFTILLGSKALNSTFFDWLPNSIVAFLGIVSSVISIIEVFINGF